MKKCSICNSKKVDNGKNWYRNSTCANCWMKRYREENPDVWRDTKLRSSYGISLLQFNELLKKQDHKCAICKRSDNKLKSGKVQHFVVDHCHSTKIVRGLLCHACNMRVGIMENWGPLLQEYINKYQK